MSTPKTRYPASNPRYTTFGTNEFNRRIEEGMKRAPEERAKAIREFWGWLTRR